MAESYFQHKKDLSHCQGLVEVSQRKPLFCWDICTDTGGLDLCQGLEARSVEELIVFISLLA